MAERKKQSDAGKEMPFLTKLRKDAEKKAREAERAAATAASAATAVATAEREVLVQSSTAGLQERLEQMRLTDRQSRIDPVTGEYNARGEGRYGGVAIALAPEDLRKYKARKGGVKPTKAERDAMDEHQQMMNQEDDTMYYSDPLRVAPQSYKSTPAEVQQFLSDYPDTENIYRTGPAIGKVSKKRRKAEVTRRGLMNAATLPSYSQPSLSISTRLEPEITPKQAKKAAKKVEADAMADAAMAQIARLRAILAQRAAPASIEDAKKAKAKAAYQRRKLAEAKRKG